MARIKPLTSSTAAAGAGTAAILPSDAAASAPASVPVAAFPSPSPMAAPVAAPPTLAPGLLKSQAVPPSPLRPSTDPPFAVNSDRDLLREAHASPVAESAPAVSAASKTASAILFRGSQAAPAAKKEEALNNSKASEAKLLGALGAAGIELGSKSKDVLSMDKISGCGSAEVGDGRPNASSKTPPSEGDQLRSC